MSDDFSIRDYMARKCVCGLSRALHAHVYQPHLVVLAVPNPGRRCQGFLDEIELRLGGCPATNELLEPLVVDQVAQAVLGVFAHVAFDPGFFDEVAGPFIHFDALVEVDKDLLGEVVALDEIDNTGSGILDVLEQRETETGLVHGEDAGPVVVDHP